MRTLKTFDFGGDRDKGSYEWEKLLDGRIHQLEEGTDYSCKTDTMLSLVRGAARRRGMKVRTGKVEGGLVIQAYPDPDAGKDKGGEE